MQKDYALSIIYLMFLPIFMFAETESEHKRSMIFENMLPLKQRYVVLSKYVVFLIMIILAFLILLVYFFILSSLDGINFNFESHIIFSLRMISLVINWGLFFIALSCTNRKPKILFMLFCNSSCLTMLPLVQTIMSINIDGYELSTFSTVIMNYFWYDTSSNDLMISCLFLLFSYPIAVYFQKRKLLTT